MNKAMSRKYYGFALTRGVMMPFWLWTDLAKLLPNDTTIVGFQHDHQRHVDQLVLHSESFPELEDMEPLKILQAEIKLQDGETSIKLFTWSQRTGAPEYVTFNTTPDGRYDGLYKAIKSLEGEAKETGQALRSGFKLFVSQDIPQGEIHFIQPNETTKIINLQTKEEIEFYESSQTSRRVRP